MLNLLNLKIIKFDILLIKNLENLKTCTLRILVVPRTCFITIVLIRSTHTPTLAGFFYHYCFG